MAWIIRDPAIWREPYRIKADPEWYSFALTAAQGECQPVAGVSEEGYIARLAMLSPSTFALCRAGARAHRAPGRAARCGVLGAWRARGSALLAARRRGTKEGCAARSRAGIEPAALAVAAAWRRTDRLDRRVHGDVRHRREFRGEAAAPRRMPGGRHRLARASRLSRRAVAEHHRPCGLRRHRPSRSRLYCAGDLLSPRRPACTTRNCRRASANWPRPGRSIAPACSARRSGWPIWCPPRSRACCRARRSRSSGIAWCCGSRANGGAGRRPCLVAAQAAGASRRPRAGGTT